MLVDWMEDANCNEIDDPEKFFDRYLQSEETMLEVQNLCSLCPVKIQCINYGIYTKATGVWGGRWLQNGKVVKRLDMIVSEYFDRD